MWQGRNFLNKHRDICPEYVCTIFIGFIESHMGVSKNNGTPKSMLIGFSIINHPFWGTPIFGTTHMNFDKTIIFTVGNFSETDINSSQL